MQVPDAFTCLQAYCGGLFLERGLEGMRPWFRELFTPWIDVAYREIKIEHGVSDAAAELDPKLFSEPSTDATQRLPPPALQPTGHLSLFNQTLTQRGRFVEWVFSDASSQARTPMWDVEALVDSRCIGRGRGGTKKAAKNDAARQALVYLGVYEVRQGFSAIFSVSDGRLGAAGYGTECYGRLA